MLGLRQSSLNGNVPAVDSRVLQDGEVLETIPLRARLRILTSHRSQRLVGYRPGWRCLLTIWISSSRMPESPNPPR